MAGSIRKTCDINCLSDLPSTANFVYLVVLRSRKWSSGSIPSAALFLSYEITAPTHHRSHIFLTFRILLNVRAYDVGEGDWRVGEIEFGVFVCKSCASLGHEVLRRQQ